MRKALHEDRPARRVRNGVPLLSRGSASAPLVTTRAVNDLLDED